MALNNAKNFAKVTVSAGYDAAATSIDVGSGEGAKLPSVPFNATWWNFTDYPDPSDDPNVEIVTVTNIVTDTLTITRAQESTSAATHNTGGKTYKLIAGLTAKVINTDIAAMFIHNEIVSGNGTSWTLANTPQTGTVKLWAQGTRLYPGSDPNFGYSITGTAITTQQSYSTGDLIADYMK